MRFRFSRRTLLTAGPAALAACTKAEEPYFGRTEPPRTQRLIYLLGAEPATLDPTLSTDRWESYVIHAMFEGLTGFHPTTGEPTAALATHCDVSLDGLKFTFYLRGHTAPRGSRLKNTSDLPPEFSRGQSAPPHIVPARWSDGATITAHDVVYSWRRALDPATGATYSYLLHCILNAEEISVGKLQPETLSIQAPSDFELRIELRAPTPFFLQLLSHRVCCAVPRRAVEKFGTSWTEAGRIVTSSAFVLRERRANDRIVLSRNPHYYEAGVVALDELEFQVVVDGATITNVYRTGGASVVQPALPQLLPALSRKKDFRSYPMFGAVFPLMNTVRPPLDDVRVRYALNMAIDKRALTQFVGAGRTKALALVPPVEGYTSPQELTLSVNGRTCDVLSYNPQAARELLISAGHGGASPLPIEFLFPNLPEARPLAEILQQQWLHVLGIELVLINQDLQTWLQTVFSKAFSGIAFWGDTGGYIDPTWFLDQFKALSPANPTGWADPQFEALLAGAATTPDRAARLTKLSESERQLLRGMPCLPLYTDVWTYLRKPFVHGLGANTLDGQPWKYAWVDTNRRPQ